MWQLWVRFPFRNVKIFISYNCSKEKVIWKGNVYLFYWCKGSVCDYKHDRCGFDPNWGNQREVGNWNNTCLSLPTLLYAAWFSVKQKKILILNCLFCPSVSRIPRATERGGRPAAPSPRTSGRVFEIFLALNYK